MGLIKTKNKKTLPYRIPDGKSPRFPKKPTIRQEGDILIMECILEAHPVPDITWFRGSTPIADTGRIKMSRRAISRDTYTLTLEISNPTRDDGGNYRCNAFNSYGESNANIALNFQGKIFTSAIYHCLLGLLRLQSRHFVQNKNYVSHFDGCQTNPYIFFVSEKISH